MEGFAESGPVPIEATDVRRVVDLLGGARVFPHVPSTPLDVHEMLLQGLPSRALVHLVGSFTSLEKPASLEKAVGMSLRTFQRRRDAPTKRLSQEQSGRIWKFAEVLAKATQVFGSQEEAERWLERPAMGLNRQCPIDLLATPAGVELVENFLTQLEYGVYV